MSQIGSPPPSLEPRMKGLRLEVEITPLTPEAKAKVSFELSHIFDS